MFKVQGIIKTVYDLKRFKRFIVLTSSDKNCLACFFKCHFHFGEIFADVMLLEIRSFLRPKTRSKTRFRYGQPTKQFNRHNKGCITSFSDTFNNSFKLGSKYPHYYIQQWIQVSLQRNLQWLHFTVHSETLSSEGLLTCSVGCTYNRNDYSSKKLSHPFFPS